MIRGIGFGSSAMVNVCLRGEGSGSVGVGEVDRGVLPGASSSKAPNRACQSSVSS